MNNFLKDNKTRNQQLSVKPFVYNRPSISKICIRFLVLLSMQIIMLFVTKSYSSLFVVLAAVLGSVAAAVINYFMTKEPLYQMMSLVIQGIFIGLLLPSTYPVVSVFFISFITILVARCIIFKSINSWLNVSVIAIIIAWLIGKNYFPSFTITTDIIPLRNASVYLIQNGNFPIYSFDSSITLFLNAKLFNHFQVSIPDGFISLLVDTKSIIPAFRFNLLTIISSIFIFSDNSFSGIIPVCFLAVYGFLVRLFCPVLFGGMLNQGDILLAFLSSGTLFCIVFLIQWFGTVPISISGKILLGVLSGIYAFTIIGCGTSPIGMVYTVFITNMTSLFIRILEEKNNIFTTAKVVSKLAAKGEQ